MIQISPALIIRSGRRMSFEDVDGKRERFTQIAEMMSSSPENEPSFDAKGADIPTEIRGSQPPPPAPRESSAAEEEKHTSKTKTIKFGASQKQKEVVAGVSAPSESLFSKETVHIKKEPSFTGAGSLLAKGLLESGVLNTSRKSPRVIGTPGETGSLPLQDGKLKSSVEGSSVTATTQALHLKVFVEGLEKPLRLKIDGPCKVADVIQMVLDQYNKGQARDEKEKDDAHPPPPPPPPPPAPATSTATAPRATRAGASRPSVSVSRSQSEAGDDTGGFMGLPPHAYELRMLDDDDGTPDMDMAPLEWSRDIQKYGVNAVAICRKPQYQGADTSSDYMRLNTDASIARTDKEQNKMFVRVILEDKEKYVFRVDKDMPLADLFPMIVKKRQTSDMPPEQYNFFYSNKETATDPIDQRILLKDLENDNLKLVHKVPTSSFIIPEPPPPITSAVTTATPAQFAFTKEIAYTYSEYRVIKTNGRGRKQKRIMGIDATMIYNKEGKLNVRHPTRLISTVRNVEVLPDAMCFAIDFEDKEAGKDKSISRREYRTETQVDCAEIVAKIQFLMKNPPKP